MASGRVLVLGYGASGNAAARLAERLGFEVAICRDESEAVVASDFAIVSPGISLSSPLIAACRERGIPLKSELQFGCEALKREGWRLIAVTGSKGKSSVVKLCADALQSAGVYAVACGNYGLPVSEVAMGEKRGAAPVAVVEVSSFQMETTELPSATFEAAAILNLQSDHLDRHGSLAAYHALKRRLLDFAKLRIEREPPRFAALYAGSYFDNPVLADNAECAVRLLLALGLDERAIAAAFANFEPLPHRMQMVGTVRGVRCVDDSKATSLAALAAAVRMVGRGVRLIAGGLPKGDLPESVVGDLTNRVKKVYLIGQSSEGFSAAWRGAVDCEICGNLTRAVSKAFAEAEIGETLLLSPGAASFDQFKNFEERGETFARLVKSEGQKHE